MPPFALCAFRFLLASLLLGAVLFPKLRTVSRKTLLYAIPAGLSLTLTYIGATVGLLYTSISNAGFICSLPVVTTPLLSFLVYRKKPERRMLLCLVLWRWATRCAELELLWSWWMLKMYFFW